MISVWFRKHTRRANWLIILATPLRIGYSCHYVRCQVVTGLYQLPRYVQLRILYKMVNENGSKQFPLDNNSIKFHRFKKFCTVLITNVFMANDRSIHPLKANEANLPPHFLFLHPFPPLSCPFLPSRRPSPTHLPTKESWVCLKQSSLAAIRTEPQQTMISGNLCSKS